MTEPLPNWRSICPSADSRACSRSTSRPPDLLAQPIRGPRTAPLRIAAPNSRAAASDGTTSPRSGSGGSSRGRSRKRSDGDVRQPGPPLAPVQPSSSRRAAAARRARAAPALVLEHEHPDAPRLAVAAGADRTVAGAAAAPERAADAGDVAGRARAEERERDVQVLGAARAGRGGARAAIPTSRRASSSGSRRAQKRRSRHRRPTLAADVSRCRHDSVSKSPHEVQRRDGRPRRERSRGRPGSSNSSASLPSGPRRGGSTSPTGFSGVPPPGPAMPVTATATSAPSRRARRPPSRPPSRPTRRRVGRAPSAGTPSPRAFTSSAYATIAADEDVARSRHGGQPGGDEPAGARLRGRERQARARRAPSTSSSTGALPREQVAARSARERPLQRLRAPLGAGLDDRSTWISKSRAQIGRLDAVAVAARRPRAPAPRRLGCAEEAEDAPPRRRRAREHRRTGSVSSALGQSPWSSRGGPGRRRDRAAVSSTSPGPFRPGRRPSPAGSVACLRRRREVRVRPVSRSATRREMPSIRARSASSTTSGAPRAREQLDRAVVVCRAEPAGDDAELGLSPSRSAASSSSARRRRSDLRRLDTEPESGARGTGRCGRCGRRATSSRARDDDRRTRPCQEAGRMPVGVTTITRGRFPRSGLIVAPRPSWRFSRRVEDDPQQPAAELLRLAAEERPS